jgi:hypothetical protein
MPSIVRLAAHSNLERAKRCDAIEQICGQRGRPVLMDIEDLAPEVGSADDLDNPAAAVQAMTLSTDNEANRSRGESMAQRCLDQIKGGSVVLLPCRRGAGLQTIADR